MARLVLTRKHGSENRNSDELLARGRPGLVGPQRLPQLQSTALVRAGTPVAPREEYLEENLQGLEREIAEVRARLEEIRRSRGETKKDSARGAA
jgi:hypothetical protein